MSLRGPKPKLRRVEFNQNAHNLPIPNSQVPNIFDEFLPTDCTRMVLSHLNFAELGEAALVCKTFHRLSNLVRDKCRKIDARWMTIRWINPLSAFELDICAEKRIERSFASCGKERYCLTPQRQLPSIIYNTSVVRNSSKNECATCKTLQDEPDPDRLLPTLRKVFNKAAKFIARYKFERINFDIDDLEYHDLNDIFELIKTYIPKPDMDQINMYMSIGTTVNFQEFMKWILSSRPNEFAVTTEDNVQPMIDLNFMKELSTSTKNPSLTIKLHEEYLSPEEMTLMPNSRSALAFFSSFKDLNINTLVFECTRLVELIMYRARLNIDGRWKVRTRGELTGALIRDLGRRMQPQMEGLRITGQPNVVVLKDYNGRHTRIMSYPLPHRSDTPDDELNPSGYEVNVEF